ARLGPTDGFDRHRFCLHRLAAVEVEIAGAKPRWPVAPGPGAGRALVGPADPVEVRFAAEMQSRGKTLHLAALGAASIDFLDGVDEGQGQVIQGAGADVGVQMGAAGTNDTPVPVQVRLDKRALDLADRFHQLWQVKFNAADLSQRRTEGSARRPFDTP